MQACAAAAAPVSSRVLQTGKRRVSATGGARSDRGRGEVSATSNRGGERRDSVFSTPDPAHLRRLCSTDGRPSVERYSRPNHGFRWFGMFERSSVVLVGTFHLQKSYGRTRPRRRTRTAGEQGSSRCSRTSMNTCGECSAGQRAQSSTRTARKSGPCWSHAMEGTSIRERSAALTCAVRNRITRLENRALRVPFQASPRGVRGSARRSHH